MNCNGIVIAKVEQIWSAVTTWQEPRGWLNARSQLQRGMTLHDNNDSAHNLPTSPAVILLWLNSDSDCSLAVSTAHCRPRRKAKCHIDIDCVQ